MINIFKQNNTNSIGKIADFINIKYVMHNAIRKGKRNNLRVESKYRNYTIDNELFWIETNNNK